MKKDWEEGLLSEVEWPTGEVEAGREFFDASLRLVGAAADAGVPVIPGTDCNYRAPYQFAGFSLHDELALLVRAGVSPMQAIQSATRDPAPHATF